MGLTLPRRIRYSLLSVMALLTVLCVAFGYWSSRAHRQRNAVRQLRDAGAVVKYSDRTKLR